MKILKARITKKKVLTLITIIFVCILTIVHIFNEQQYVSTDDAYVETVPTVVAPKVAGQIIRIHVKDNEKVKKGDLLVEIDPVDYEAKVAEITALYNSALLKQKNAKANLNATNSELALAKKNLDRYTDLYNDGAVSKLEYDKAKLNYDSVLAKQVNSEQNILSKDKNNVADEDLKVLAAKKEQAELALSYTKIYATLDGTISNKSIEEGSLAGKGQPLFSIVPDNVWVIANFKENQIRDMHKGQAVNIKIDTYPDKKFKGRIDSIQQISGAKSSMFPPENAVGSFVKIVQRIPVKIVFTEDIDKSKYNVIAGMSAVPKVKVK